MLFIKAIDENINVNTNGVKFMKIFVLNHKRSRGAMFRKVTNIVVGNIWLNAKIRAFLRVFFMLFSNLHCKGKT